MYSNRISGGSLGWKGKGALMPEFEKVAFELEVSTIGSPKWAECVCQLIQRLLSLLTTTGARQVRAIIL